MLQSYGKGKQPSSTVMHDKNDDSQLLAKIDSLLDKKLQKFQTNFKEWEEKISEKLPVIDLADNETR